MNENNEKEYNYRKGRTLRWGMSTHWGFSNGVTIDNLDTKTISQAENDFEKLFISIREELKNNESRCLDDRDDLLNVCQNVAFMLKKTYNLQDY